MSHPYFENLNWIGVYQGLVPRKCLDILRLQPVSVLTRGVDTTDDNKPHFGRVRFEPAKCDLTFAAWHCYQEDTCEYDSHGIFGQVVNSRREVVYSYWLLDNNAVKDQINRRLLDFEWPQPPRNHGNSGAAPPMLFRKLARRARQTSPLPAPPGFPRTPGHRPTHGLPPSSAGQSPPIAPARSPPLYPPGLPHPQR